jgi:aconitate hydratase
VVPPGTGICHQVNLEYLAQTVWTAPEAAAAPITEADSPQADAAPGDPAHEVAYPDTVVGNGQPHHHGQRS